MKAQLPLNELARLEALRQYEILDSAKEQVFEEIAGIAAAVFGVPMVAISLVDSDRQWFKAKVGLDVESTSRDIAFCSHAILASGVLEVPDARADERFQENPLVTEEPNVRFYAGCPLITPDGHALGTVCILDAHPRKLTDEETKVLSSLALVTMTLIEMRRNAKHLMNVNEALAGQVARLKESLRA